MVMMHLICRGSRIQFEILLSEQELPYLLPRVKNIAYSAVMAEQDWATELAHGVADEVRRLRKDRGLSVAKLADRTEELGYPIGASVLTNFEAKRRGSRLDVSELLVLAAALDVPPALLLFPGYPDGPARPLPGLESSAFKSAEWFAGRQLLMVDPDPEKPSIEPFPTHLVGLVGEREGLFFAWVEAVRGGKGSGKGTPAGDVLERRAALNRRIEEAGGVIGDGARPTGD